ncbi:MAG TPA: helix-turn-helix transcriptional regulator [Gemmatimonadales bacterium]|jgi:DNA-binding PadR family transcriptional regulator
MSARPLSPTTTAVLKAIAENIRHGFEIMAATALPSGTVYPILSRLERDALVRAKWESPEIAQKEKRPARRYYEISAAGHRSLADALIYYRKLSTGRAAPSRA